MVSCMFQTRCIHIQLGMALQIQPGLFHHLWRKLKKGEIFAWSLKLINFYLYRFVHGYRNTQIPRFCVLNSRLYTSSEVSWSEAELQFLLPVGSVRVHLPGLPPALLLKRLYSVIKKGHSPLWVFLQSCAHSASDVASYSLDTRLLLWPTVNLCVDSLSLISSSFAPLHFAFALMKFTK